MNEVESFSKRWPTVKSMVLYIEALGAIQFLIQVLIISYVSDPALNHQRELILSSLRIMEYSSLSRSSVGCLSCGPIRLDCGKRQPVEAWPYVDSIFRTLDHR